MVGGNKAPLRAAIWMATVVATLATTFLHGSGAAGAGRAPAAKLAQVGRWSEPVELHVIAIHSALLATGEVVLFSYPAPGKRGSETWVWDSATQISRKVPTVTRRDVFCSGHSLLPDGRLFVTGGAMWGPSIYQGARQTSFFDPSKRIWSPGPDMAFPRWYPTNLTLPSGDVLIVSGSDVVGHDVRSIERFSMQTGAVTRLPASADVKTFDYPRLHLLTDGKVLLAGQGKATSIFDPETLRWSAVDEMIAGDRFSGATVLLPDLHRVLALGGNTVDPEVEPPTSLPPTDTAEILDLSEQPPRWRPTASMRHARQHANAILLPNGTVLVVGGGQSGLFSKPVRQPELFDPETETWSELASETTARNYHSTALLLPDGRVLSAGMDHGKLQTTGEVYSPPYLFRGPRPRITASPSRVGYGETFAIATPEASTVARVALLRAGSSTHSVDFDQRYVGLAFSVERGDRLEVEAPADGATAPPGSYMLFVVNETGVPSVAAWVRVG